MTEKRNSFGLPLVVAQSVQKKDVVTIVRSIKSQVRNPVLCRESLLHLHAKLFEGVADRKESIAKFMHPSTGGIQVVLAAMEHHISDLLLIESAVVLLYTISHSNSRRNVRVLQRLVKKGSSKVLLSVLTYHRATPSIFVPCAACLVSMTSFDNKLPAQVRLSGCLTTLVAILKAPPCRDVTASALSCLCAFARSDQNLQTLTKKSCTQLVMDLVASKLSKPGGDGGSLVVKFATKLLLMLCRNENNVVTVIQSAGVKTMMNLLQEPGLCVESTKSILELLQIVVKYDDGGIDFERAGGKSHLIQVVMSKAAAGKRDDQILEIINQLFRFHNVIDLPLGNDANIEFDLPVPGVGEDGTGTSSIEGMPSLLGLSPELNPAQCPPRPSGVAVNHVRPFVPPRPAPSCSSSINWSPPSEGLYTPPPNLKSELIAQLMQRLISKESDVEDTVVFDDVPRGVDLKPKPTAVSPFPPLTFSSQFESGNLRRALRVGAFEYDLILNCDINTCGHIQWFYFAVEGMTPGVPYKFNIINMEKVRSTFNEGQRILMFSEKEFTTNGTGWIRGGTNIAYIPNSYKRKQRGKGGGDSDSDEGGPSSKNGPREKSPDGCYFTLTFAITFNHKNDRVYFANCYPYTYSDLLHYLSGLKDVHPHLEDYCVIHNLCNAVDGNAIPMLTITTLRREDGEKCSTEEISKRRICLISARVHPGESNSSYMMKGLLDLLLDGVNPESMFLRNNFVWKIIPMITVDGVVNGNHRCSLIGKDLNREYLFPSFHTQPAIYTIKAYVKHMKEAERRNVFFYCDLHGHSRKPNFFFLGCGGGRKISGLVLEQVFPKLLADICPFFRFDESKFRILKGKEPTGRVVMWKEYGIRHSYTLEASMMGGLPRDVADKLDAATISFVHYNTADFALMGRSLGLAMGEFVKSEGDPNGSLNEIIASLLETTGATLRLHRCQSMPSTAGGDEGGPVIPPRRRNSTQSSSSGYSLPVPRPGRVSSAEVEAARHVLFHWVAPARSEVKGDEEDDEDFGYEEDDDDQDRDSEPGDEEESEF